MEELRRCLSGGGASGCTVLEAITRLRALILELQSNPNSQEANEALNLLWSSIASTDTLTAQACGELLSELVETGIMAASPCISQLLACLAHGSNTEGIIPALGNIITHQVVQNIATHQGKYVGQYAISSNQHPFISVLRSTPSTWPLILDQCLSIMEHDEKEVRENSLDILNPVLLFVFCDPNYHEHFGSLRAALLHKLVKMAKLEELAFDYLLKLCKWQKVTCRMSLADHSLIIYYLYEISLFKGDSDFLKGAILKFASLAYQQVKFGMSPRIAIEKITNMFLLNIHSNWNLVLLMMDKTLQVASPDNHPVLLTLCLKLIDKGVVGRLPASVLVATCLQSLSFQNTEKNLESASLKADFVRLFYKMQHNWPEEDLKEYWIEPEEGHFDENINTAIEQVKLFKNLDDPLPWLEHLSTQPHPQLSRLLPALAAYFLCSKDAGGVSKTLKLILQCVEKTPDSSSYVLTLLLHKLSSPAQEPDVRVALLQALPLMSKDKACISMIIKLLGPLSSRPGLGALKLSLLSKLWRMEGRCYPFLQKALQEPVPQSCAADYRITQATIIRDIVSSHAVQYGSDLLPSLSSILNQSSGEESTAAAVLALQGIKSLCKEGVIDMQTTIKVLAPKCSKDPRPPVTREYVSLLGLAPTFKLSGPEYLKFLNSMLNWLWTKADDNNTETSVIESIFQAIAKFPLESTKLAMLPRDARSGLKLPPKYCATPAEAARRPEDVLPYVPAECWPRLFNINTHENHAKGVECLLGSLLGQEVSNLPRAVYSLSSAMQNRGTEPANYSHLPDSSVLRGCVESLQAAALQMQGQGEQPIQQGWQEAKVEALLRLLGGDYSRALPPLDWSFLEPFFSSCSLRPWVVGVLCRQAHGARSARTLVERQVGAQQPKDTTLAYMKQLGLLASSLAPGTVASFLGRALNMALSESEAGCTEAVAIFSQLESLLTPDNTARFSPEMVAGMGQVVEGLGERLQGSEGQLMAAFLGVASKLPRQHLTKLSSPGVWWEVTQPRLCLASSLLTLVSCSPDTDTPLTWFNELVEVCSKQQADHSFLLRGLAQVVTHCRGQQLSINTAYSWLLELMGQVSALARNTSTGGLAGAGAGALVGGSSSSSHGLSFLLDTFSLTCIYLTETESLIPSRDLLPSSRSQRLQLLPLAVARLRPNLAAQLVDWSLGLLRHTAVTAGEGQQEKLPQGIRQALRNSLQALKGAPLWSESSVWGRVVMAG